MTPVDLRGPLPTGTVVLEASAGTGKTYTIAGLVTRYVAEGHAPLERLLGSVAGVRGTTALSTTYSTLRAKHRLRAWIELLALAVGRPDQAWRAVAVGRRGHDALTWVVGPVDQEVAAAALLDLVGLRDAGLRTPLPLPVRTAEGFARRKRYGALGEWRSSYEVPGEDADAEHVLCWGASAPLEVLLAWRSPVLPGVGFADLVTRVWGPVLAAEGGR